LRYALQPHPSSLFCCAYLLCLPQNASNVAGLAAASVCVLLLVFFETESPECGVAEVKKLLVLLRTAPQKFYVRLLRSISLYRNAWGFFIRI
ncbi:hypothetical protein, partial [Bacteroides heparinolyticus]|uniref:hypothetical protein n=1 Tax=Prevotella heparinolytica TaxID=28113 RepID=UPI0035A085A1